MVKVEPNIEIDCENERVKEIEARIETHTYKREYNVYFKEFFCQNEIKFNLK